MYHGVLIENGLKPDDKIDLVKYPARLGITLELCAGIVDKDLSLKEIAREEILEECGFNVSSDRIEDVMTYRYVEFDVIFCPNRRNTCGDTSTHPW